MGVWLPCNVLKFTLNDVPQNEGKILRIIPMEPIYLSLSLSRIYSTLIVMLWAENKKKTHTDEKPTILGTRFANKYNVNQNSPFH